MLLPVFDPQLRVVWNNTLIFTNSNLFLLDLVTSEVIDKDGLPPLSCQVALEPGLFQPGEYE